MTEKKLLFENKWLNVYELAGWFVASSPARSKDHKAVAVLPYIVDEDGDPVTFLARLEYNPAHGATKDCLDVSIITGACETGDQLHHAKMELLEESGYDIEEDRFEHMGMVRLGKADMTEMHLYAVEITAYDIQGDQIPDGDNESVEDVMWVSAPVMLTSKDPYTQTIMLRQMAMNAIGAKEYKELEKEASDCFKEDIMDEDSPFSS